MRIAVHEIVTNHDHRIHHGERLRARFDEPKILVVQPPQLARVIDGDLHSSLWVHSGSLVAGAPPNCHFNRREGMHFSQRDHLIVEP